ncbi:MAG: DUF4340 domain-containing protein [Lentimicrobium sp.]|jgi:hypothetical protein|nr:DUF4340 domain-containing protein [Lentimicrobium sp.]MDD2527581.1 DUF4340 domain-containing protein [Lentimicrobiaceae bacterium]MDD4597106.1 DUF4340 domain-containing protein [Lentimicrobiaceae bacterium]MDY0025107.1 DUF4340 domain-containing protein [Lentimicrobium sp.]HAH59584.1 hypothetical protein [Bacteroidales bacterium]
MRKNRIVLFIIVLILGVLAAVLILGRSGTTLDSRTGDFAVPDTAAITRIFMADKSDRTVLLERQPDGTWMLNGQYKAHQENMGILLNTIANIAVRQPVARAAHDNILKLLAARSVKVEVYKNSYRIKLGSIRLFPYEKKARTFYIGDATMDNNGSYALIEGAGKPVVVYLPGLRGYISSRFTTLENDWRMHTIFAHKLPEIASIEVNFPLQPSESFRLVNNDNKSISLFQLESNMQVTDYDTLKLMNYINAYRNIRFETLLNDMEPERRDSITSQSPIYIITLNTTDGQTMKVKTFARKLPVPELDVFDDTTIIFDRDRMYALINDDKDFVLIQYFVFDKILRPLSWFTTPSSPEDFQ